MVVGPLRDATRTGAPEGDDEEEVPGVDEQAARVAASKTRGKKRRGRMGSFL